MSTKVDDAEKHILVGMADFHSGCRISLMPKRVTQKDGPTLTRGKTQKFIGKVFDGAFKTIKGFVDDGYKLLLALDGDLADGPRNAFELWTTDLRVQRDALIELLNPWANLCGADKNSLFVARGTPYHVGPDGLIEDEIARELGAFEGRSHYKLELDIQGLKFLCHHQGPSPGSRVWSNSIELALRDIAFRRIRADMEPPDWVMWAHYHTFAAGTIHVEYKGKFKTITGVILPAWVSAQEYSMVKIKHLEFADIGLVYWLIENGQVTDWGPIMKRHDAVMRVKV